MQRLEDYIVPLIEKGGPEPSEYSGLNHFFINADAMLKANIITSKQIYKIWEMFGDAFSEKTIQGFAVKKPHGYSGDFEIIDRIYTNWISPEKNLQNWDKFFHWQKAPVAVRNRKSYLKNILHEIENSELDTPSILNIGCGPSRDIYEYIHENPNTKISFDCLDMDANAIDYSKKLLNGTNVKFICKNAFRFRPDRQYDLIWSAGLFDYLDEKKFVFLIKSLLKSVASDGQLIVGNFSKFNTSRSYMEFGEWYLFHRDLVELTTLAYMSGVPMGLFNIESEPSGVNLFLRIFKQ